MKLKKFSVTAIVAVIVAMSIATTVFATSVPAEQAVPIRPGSYRRAELVESTDDSIRKGVMSKLDENGNTIYSVDDGETWMSEDRFHAEYGSGWGDGWRVEWWTAEDYAAWLEQEKKDLQEMTGERGYNPTDGWFTWDQQKVGEAIALYESILEDIRNGALLSKTIIDNNGNTIDDVALGSSGIMIASCFDSVDMVELKPEDTARQRGDLFQECAPFGLTGSEKEGLFYNGRSVRAFVDGYSAGNNGYAVRYAYYDENGTVDLHTMRAYIRYADGSYDPAGDLIALVTKEREDFDQGLIDCANPAGGGQTTFTESGRTALIEGNDRIHLDGGKTFEEIFAQYETYGLTCVSGENSFVNLSYNGQSVSRFADLKPNGSAFTYDNPYAEDGVTVCTVYDKSGFLTGLEIDRPTL